MSDLITIMESQDVIFTMTKGELRGWVVQPNGNIVEVDTARALQIERNR